MKRLILYLLQLTAIFTCAHSQLLWKVTGNGAKDASYLFGTHHIAPASIIDSVAGFHDALGSVDMVYGEIVISEMEKQESQLKIMRYMMAPSDSTLSEILTARQLDSVVTVMNRYMPVQVKARDIDMLKPVSISVQLSALQALKVFHQQGEAPDLVIQKLAKDKGKPVDGLESIDCQCEILFNWPIALQAEELMRSVRQDEQQAQWNIELANLYLSQSLDGMWEMMNRPELAMDETQAERLLYARNKQWVGKISAILPHKSAMFVIGAGHLPGRKGLISLLRQAGYSVDPVM